MDNPVVSVQETRTAVNDSLTNRVRFNYQTYFYSIAELY